MQHSCEISTLKNSNQQSFFRKKSVSNIEHKMNSSQSTGFFSLNFITLSPTKTKDSKKSFLQLKRFDEDSICDLVVEIIDKIYTKDHINYRKRILNFIHNEFKDRKNLKDRLNTLIYLEESLRYKYLSEIELEIIKEWKKNPLFVHLMRFWYDCIRIHKFSNVQQFCEEYKNMRTFIANVSHNFFCYVLDHFSKKNIDTFDYLLQQTSHHITNNSKNWTLIYDTKLVPLLKQLEEEEQLNLVFDLNSLRINERFFDVQNPQNMLMSTTKTIRMFIDQPKIHEKIKLLKEIRQELMRQIENNRKQFCIKKGINGSLALEKDDIIDCIIYILIKGQFNDMKTSLHLLNLLLGHNSDLLSKKGVDSYKVDLQVATEYLSLSQHNFISSLIQVPKKQYEILQGKIVQQTSLQAI